MLKVLPGEHKLLIDVFDENKKMRHDFIGRVTIPLDNSRIIISNEQNPNSHNKIDFTLEKKTYGSSLLLSPLSSDTQASFAFWLIWRFLSKVKGKLTLLIHYLSSISAYEQEINQLGSPPVVLPGSQVAPFSLIPAANAGPASSQHQQPVSGTICLLASMSGPVIAYLRMFLFYKVGCKWQQRSKYASVARRLGTEIRPERTCLLYRSHIETHNLDTANKYVPIDFNEPHE